MDMTPLVLGEKISKQILSSSIFTKNAQFVAKSAETPKGLEPKTLFACKLECLAVIVMDDAGVSLMFHQNCHAPLFDTETSFAVHVHPFEQTQLIN